MINDKNDNKVQLLGFYGDDKVHACSAWTSTSRDLNEDKINRIPKLLKMLADAGHHTPFEKSSLHFLVDTDIASHIHLLKHRVGVSINGESARYKEIKEDKYLIPSDWGDIESTFDKEGVQNSKWTTILEDYTHLGNTLYHQCVKDLEPTLGRKRAKESFASSRLITLKFKLMLCLIGAVFITSLSFATSLMLRKKSERLLLKC